MVTASADIELVSAAKSGNIVALGTLLERHRASLCATALSILGDYALAQDVVHDAFLIVLRRMSDLRDPSAVGPWLHAIVRNACRMHLRSRREVTGDDTILTIPGDVDVEQALEQMALRDWVWTALGALPEDLCVTIMLRYFAGNLSYAQIAGVLGVPVGTVRSRLHYARRLLAAELTATASTAHGDHAALLRERWQWWAAAVDEIERHERAAIYAQGCAPDVVIEASALSNRVRGVAERQLDVIDTIAVGVSVRLTGIVASSTVTILEIEFDNPPYAPGLCPPKHTELRFHARDLTTRINLYYHHRPDDPAAAVTG
jgi:RNA polymerase sigma factor (sigma-70 family)